MKEPVGEDNDFSANGELSRFSSSRQGGPCQPVPQFLSPNFRDRINHVHYRNVRVETPYANYTEVFHDEGDCDMLACMGVSARSTTGGC